MPDDAQPAESEIINNRNHDPSNPEDTHMSQAFQASMMQIFGEQESYKPTKQQVDKMLALQEKGMDYTHRERTMYQPKQVLDFAAFGVILLFILGLLALIVVKAPQYTSQAVSNIIGLIGGGGIGYGFGIKRSKGQND